MTTAITAHTIIERITDAMISTPLDEGMVGLSMESDKCYSMNSTATRIWELLEEPQSAAAIAAQLCAEFDGPADQIADAVQTILGSFAEEGLVRAIA
jgi:hypothetical protein